MKKFNLAPKVQRYFELYNFCAKVDLLAFALHATRLANACTQSTRFCGSETSALKWVGAVLLPTIREVRTQLVEEDVHTSAQLGGEHTLKSVRKDARPLEASNGRCGKGPKVTSDLSRTLPSPPPPPKPPKEDPAYLSYSALSLSHRASLCFCQSFPCLQVVSSTTSSALWTWCKAFLVSEPMPVR